MQIQFLGASGTVTGSSYLLNAGKNKILIDLGMFQGHEDEQFNKEEFFFDSKDLSAVIITHAHLDHCGRLPLLIKFGYEGKIFMTAETKLLVNLALTDAVKVAYEHGNNNNQNYDFSEEEVEKTLKQVIIVKYNEPIFLGDTRIIFHNSGHILGASSIEISEEGKTIIFSGDIGNPQSKLLQPMERMQKADVVVMESTYGNRLHPNQNPSITLQEEIESIEKLGGVLLIPAFAMDRTQVLLHLINHLKKEEKIKKETPIFLDSPMAIKATMIYKNSRNLWSDELKSHSDNPFDFPNLILTQEAKESEEIIKTKGSKIIIAGNGMMTGGRIWHHLINYLPLPTSRLLIVGYQGEGTLGREILNGKKQVNVYHEEVNVNAKIREEGGLSAHADQKGLLDWLSKIEGVNEVFLIHGDDPSRQALAAKIQNELSIKNVFLPARNSLSSI